jgi:hypothetical protein
MTTASRQIVDLLALALVVLNRIELGPPPLGHDLWP